MKNLVPLFLLMTFCIASAQANPKAFVSSHLAPRSPQWRGGLVLASFMAKHDYFGGMSDISYGYSGRNFLQLRPGAQSAFEPMMLERRHVYMRQAIGQVFNSELRHPLGTPF